MTVRRPLRAARPAAALLLLGCGGPPAPESAGPAAPPRTYPTGWEEAALQVGDGRLLEGVLALERFIEREMAVKRIPALSIALVRDTAVLFTAGYGFADPETRRVAAPGTLYRVGSVSKLFTDMAVMRLVEEGRLTLDDPVRRWLPELAGGPAGESTLRQLMTHRAGIVREPPVGHYFDPTEPSLRETVASMAPTPRVYPAGERTKYSNAGVAIVGRVVEEVTGEPFEAYVRRVLLEPAGMTSSAFYPDAALRARLARAVMWAYDRPDWPAPTFELGTPPAGNLYSTVEDLGRFLTVLLARGEGPGGPLVSPATLDSMWTVQLAGPDATRGFGLGFVVDELDGRRTVGHGGWVYGFATEVRALPDDGLGVAVAATVDGANAVVERIAEAALRMMLAARDGAPVVMPQPPARVDREVAERLEGRYRRGEHRLELDEQGGALFLVDEAGRRLVLGALGDTLITDDRLSVGRRLLPLPAAEGRSVTALVTGADTLLREETPPPAPLPAAFEPLVGEYGWDHNVLYVLEQDRRLHILIEWFFQDPLDAGAADTFRLPDRGLYAGERVVFERDGAGGVTGVRVGGVFFPRRAVGPDEGVTFRIEPVRPVAELRREALAARPPREEGPFREPDLVELRSLDPTIRYDIRYAGTNNFMGDVFYTEPRAYLQRPAAEAVVRAHRSLAPHGYGLLIHDAYRPWHVTKMFWDATPDSLKVFVADPAAGSRHNRGAAVDLTLYDLRTGEPVDMPSGYDEFTPRAFADYPGGTHRQRWLRELLRDAMEAQGFDVYPAEWWHFDYGDWRRYPILNRTFEELERGG